MDVAISSLRAELASWIDRARSGEEVVITDRGVPVARLSAIDTAPLIDQLTHQGVLAKPLGPHRPSARETKRIRAREPVSELISEQRR